MSRLSNFTLVTDFCVDEKEGLIPNAEAPTVVTSLSSRLHQQLADDATIRRDQLVAHFPDSFHDPTILGLESAVGADQLQSTLQGLQLVTDRRSLRKLIMSECLQLPDRAYYCKKEDLDLMAEKINGTVYLGGLQHYEETK